MAHDHDKAHGDLDLCPGPLLGGPPEPEQVWVVLDCFGEPVGVSPSEAEAQQTAVEHWGKDRRYCPTWPELEARALYELTAVEMRRWS